MGVKELTEKADLVASLSFSSNQTCECESDCGDSGIDCSDDGGTY